MQCPNCDGTDFRWYISNDVVDGRLRMHDIQVIAYLACEECSETLQIIHEDEINKRLNRS